MAELNFCLQAAALHDEDSGALSDAIERYTTAGMPMARAQLAAIADVIADVRTQREQIMAAAREQHPGALGATGQAHLQPGGGLALTITPNGAGSIVDPDGSVLSALQGAGVHATRLGNGTVLVPRSQLPQARRALKVD